jgi:acetoin utilization deacetylase AcuC-like enzyme
MTGLVADSDCKQHLTGSRHPERPERFDAAVGALQGMDLVPIATRAANVDEIALCHGREYIQLAEREIAAGLHELSTGDTIISPRSWDAALHATGGHTNSRNGFLPVQLHRHCG